MGIDSKTLPDSLVRCMGAADRARLGLASVVDATAPAARNKEDMKRERDLQIQIVSFLRMRGHTVIWSRLDRRLTATKGTPDILLAVHGRAVALEAKLPGGKLSEDQERMRDGLIADGWKYALVTSLEEAKAVVDAVK